MNIFTLRCNGVLFCAHRSGLLTLVPLPRPTPRPDKYPSFPLLYCEMDCVEKEYGHQFNSRWQWIYRVGLFADIEYKNIVRAILVIFTFPLAKCNYCKLLCCSFSCHTYLPTFKCLFEQYYGLTQYSARSVFSVRLGHSYSSNWTQQARVKLNMRTIHTTCITNQQC